MARILVITLDPPSRAFRGAHVSFGSLLRHLRSQGHSIHLVMAAHRRPRRGVRQELKEFVDSWSFLELAGASFPTPLIGPLQRATRPPRAYLARVRHWFRDRTIHGVPITRQILSLLSRHQPDLVMVNETWMVPLVHPIRPLSPAPWVVNTHDILHHRVASFQAAGLESPYEISRDEEIALLSVFDLVLAVQKDDAKVLSTMLPSHRVVGITCARPVEPLPGDQPIVSFVGAHCEPNAHGIVRMIEEAWPRIQRACPSSRLRIIGSVCKDKTLHDAAKMTPSVELVGPVPDIRTAYDGPAVVVCPLWAGSGLKVKMVESLAHGKATVTTPVGAQGITEGAGTAFWIADQPRDFAEPVIELLMQPKRRHALEQAALQFARRFDPGLTYRDLDLALDEILPSSPGQRMTG